MDRKTKVALKETFKAKFQGVNAAIVAEYRGMTVAELTDLRTELRKNNAEFRILKNRVAKKAMEEVPHLAPILNDLKGPAGIIYLNGDAAAAAKVAIKFQDDHPNFIVKAGLLDAQRFSTSELKVVADLPPKEVLLARIIGTLVSPHRQLLTVLNGVPRQLVQVINAIKEKKA